MTREQGIEKGRRSETLTAEMNPISLSRDARTAAISFTTFSLDSDSPPAFPPCPIAILGIVAESCSASEIRIEARRAGATSFIVRRRGAVENLSVLL